MITGGEVIPSDDPKSRQEITHYLKYRLSVLPRTSQIALERVKRASKRFKCEIGIQVPKQQIMALKPFKSVSRTGGRTGSHNPTNHTKSPSNQNLPCPIIAQ